MKASRFDLFNRIARVYGWFYAYQKGNYRRITNNHLHQLRLSTGATILDVGCGTGAFCSVMNERGFQVTGIDPAVRMLEIGRSKKENQNIVFLKGSVLTGLPFADNSFDLVFASYVAHGFKQKERMMMYREMKRVSKKQVLIHDFSQASSLLIRIVEAMEKSDYEHFIGHVTEELQQVFNQLRVLPAGRTASWYVAEKQEEPVR